MNRLDLVAEGSPLGDKPDFLYYELHIFKRSRSHAKALLKLVMINPIVVNQDQGVIEAHRLMSRHAYI